MNYFFEISIIVLTLIITIIPFTGDLWEKKKRKIKFYKRGIVFLLFSLLGLFLAVIHIIKETNEQNERDTTQNKTFDNTKTILTRIDSSVVQMEINLARIDSLNIKINSINSKTISSLDKRNDILEKFNELNNSLDKIYIQENIKISENIPSINILDDVIWNKNDGSYKISIIFSNTGGRFAKNFNFQVIFFEINSFNNIVNHKILTKDLITAENIPTNKSSGKKLRYNLPYQSEKIIEKSKLPRGYILIYYNYLDYIDDTKFSRSDKYIYRGFKLDSLKWKTMPKSIFNKVEKYNNENKIN